MSTRESLHALVETLSEEELEALWAELSAHSNEDGPAEPPLDQVVIDARYFLALASLWDNDDDSIFDTL